MWRCKQCGDCCRLIVIPVEENVDIETVGYLEAHGICYKDGRVIIPAVCKYLTKDNRCSLHESNTKFANCRLAGAKECKGTQKDLKCLLNLKS